MKVNCYQHACTRLLTYVHVFVSGHWDMFPCVWDWLRVVPSELSSTAITNSTASTSGCAIKYIMGHQSPSLPLSIYLDRYWHIQGDKNGRIYLWDIRKVNIATPLSPSGTHSEISALPESSACIADSWEHPAMPCGLTDKLVCITCTCDIMYRKLEHFRC